MWSLAKLHKANEQNKRKIEEKKKERNKEKNK
jgi:hypothetical protein